MEKTKDQGPDITTGLTKKQRSKVIKGFKKYDLGTRKSKSSYKGKEQNTN